MILDKLKARFSKPNNLSKRIEELGLTTRTYHILRRAEILTVGELVQLSWDNIRSMRRANRATCDEVERVLKGLGLELRKDGK